MARNVGPHLHLLCLTDRQTDRQTDKRLFSFNSFNEGGNSLHAGYYFNKLCRLLTFFYKIYVFKTSFRNTIRVQTKFSDHLGHTLTGNEFTLNALIASKVVCFFRLLKCLRSLYGKQCGPRSDCSYRSSLFWVHTA